MAKGNINANFENLKAEMLKKKEISESKIKIKNDDNFVNNYVDVNENNLTIETEEVVIDENTNQSATNISQNKIVIKKTKKPQPPKRITYYLNQDTIKKIEKYSKLTGMGKSELVQTLLDVALNNLEIE